MSILDMVMSAGEGAAVKQIGSQFGLSDAQTSSALAALMPALAAGFHKNLQSPDGLTGLVSALTGGSHDRFINDPAALASGAAVDEGNGILGHVLGSKDASRQVAANAAAQSGISADILKQMLPLAASMMMGVFAQQQRQGSAASLAGTGGLMDMLTPLLTQGAAGNSMAGGLSGLLGRFLGR